MKPPVVIVGMHRSGTSLVGSIVAALGVDMGETAKADLYNTGGYFEDLRLLHLNEALLSELGGAWNAPPSSEEIETYQPKIQNAYAEYIASRAGERQWGVKDPRLSLFLHEFLDLLEDARVIHCERDCAQVAGSLLERDLFPTEQSLYLKQRYDEGVRAAVGDMPYLVMNYSMLRASPEKEIQRLAGFLELAVTEDALDLVQDEISLRGQKRAQLMRAMWQDLRRVLRSPSLLLQRRSYVRALKYLHSVSKAIRLKV
jgi:hypothetical protein